MLTKIEITGFKSFSDFDLELSPLTAIVGPNATGKSNLFDAVRFLSLLAQHDIRTAMQGLRGLPEELFRQSPSGQSRQMSFAIEVFLPKRGVDAFGSEYEITAQRLRYELGLRMVVDHHGKPRGVIVHREACYPLAKKDDNSKYLSSIKISYNSRINPFIRLNEGGDALEVRQDGRQKHGKPMRFSLKDAARSALSTITTSEFPHLYALRHYLASIKFLEINPQAARLPNDLFEDRILRPDASNLSAVLSRIKDQSASRSRPDGALADIAADLGALIPSVKRINLINEPDQRQFAFSLDFSDRSQFSSRVISDGTLRLLALLTVLRDPDRRGTLCFEEPENGVHEGRIGILIKILRSATRVSVTDGRHPFQILMNTHSPKVMEALDDSEIVAADNVAVLDPKRRIRSVKTRMRTHVVESSDLYDPERNLTRTEIERLLQKAQGRA